MEGLTLKSRAIMFALCTGAVAFVLALAATWHGVIDGGSIQRAIIPALVCGVLCWASAERSIAVTAAAIDAAIARLSRAAAGDLSGDIPPEIAANVPLLATAMDGLFQQLTTNLDNVHRLAMYDPVTELPNRTHFRRAAERLLADRRPETRTALFFVDLDRFKTVNDTMGHAVGDMLLGMVADRLRTLSDRLMAEGEIGQPLIGRLAGDEFTMLFPGLPPHCDASLIGRRLLFALTEPFNLAGTEVLIGASIGIALCPDHGKTLTDMMRAADAAMYHAKASGRGRAEHFSDVLAAEMAERAQLETDLREAVQRGEFVLAFQPQLSLTDGHIVAAEALLRWRHPSGVKLPGSFIRRAEETGLIVEIGDWVVAEVAATIARWGRLGVPQRLAINVSARQLDQIDFFRRLRDAMLAADAPARLLELEITETLAMRCSDEIVESIAALRNDGATIAIDNFGTGYSNLRRLRELPIDRIKLDRSLVEQIATRAEARAIAQAVVGLIHGLGCEAVAEGIESDAQMQMLRVIGCDVVQGYAICAPMEERIFLDWAGGVELPALIA